MGIDEQETHPDPLAPPHTDRKARLRTEVINDPLQPDRLLPSDYLGQQAMVAVRKDRRRVEVLRAASRQLRTFKPE